MEIYFLMNFWSCNPYITIVTVFSRFNFGYLENAIYPKWLIIIFHEKLINKKRQYLILIFNLQKASNQNSTATQSSNPSTAKQFKNKIVSCKPIYESKGTECVPIVKDASTQIDLDEIKLNHTVVPVPVPIHVPTPLCMYQAPMPVPILLPIPIPVPIFIPTTMKTYDRIQRRIQKLRKKLPADPYEFEILLYAEKLAREEGIPGFEDSSDGESESECSSSKRQKTSNYEHVSAIQTSDTNGQNVNNIEYNADMNQIQQQQKQQKIYNDSNSHTCSNIETNNQQIQLIQNQQQQQQIQQPEQEGKFKWIYGVNLFNTWFSTRIAQLKAKAPNSNLRLPDDILKVKDYFHIQFVRKFFLRSL